MRPVQLFLRNGVGGAHDNGSTFGEVPEYLREPRVPWGEIFTKTQLKFKRGHGLGITLDLSNLPLVGRGVGGSWVVIVIGGICTILAGVTTLKVEENEAATEAAGLRLGHSKNITSNTGQEIRGKEDFRGLEMSLLRGSECTFETKGYGSYRCSKFR